MPEYSLPDGVERFRLRLSTPFAGATVLTQRDPNGQYIEVRDLPKIEEQVRREERARCREALLLLATTHFDHERLLDDENLDASDLFFRGLLQHREIGQSGEYDTHLTAEGFEQLRAFLAALDQETDRG